MLNYSPVKRISTGLIAVCLGLTLNAGVPDATGSDPSTFKKDTGTYAPNSVYLSFGGPAIYFSLIYERQLLIEKNYSFGVKGGIGSTFSSVLFPHEFSLPVGAFFLYGKRKHHLDLSFSVSNYLIEQYEYLENETRRELKLLLVPSAGYRFQDKEGGLILRAGISPLINFNFMTDTFTPWVDLSVGWSF